jgi:hypothetical protein
VAVSTRCSTSAAEAPITRIFFTIGFAAFTTHPGPDPGAARSGKFRRGLRWLLAAIGV